MEHDDEFADAAGQVGDGSGAWLASVLVLAVMAAIAAVVLIV